LESANSSSSNQANREIEKYAAPKAFRIIPWHESLLQSKDFLDLNGKIGLKSCMMSHHLQGIKRGVPSLFLIEAILYID
jgi:hypothetical protein